MRRLGKKAPRAPVRFSRLVVLIGSFGAMAAAMMSGCASEEDEDVCREAQRRFQECGVTVPLFTDEDCSAAPEAIADCVLEVTEGCNELGTWIERLDECVGRFGDGLEPLDPAASPA